MATTTAGRLPHGWGVWKFALPIAAVLGVVALGYAVATNLNRNPPVQPPVVETATPTPTQGAMAAATPEVSIEVQQAIYQNNQLTVNALLKNNSSVYAASGVEVMLAVDGSVQDTFNVPFIGQNGVQSVSFQTTNFAPGSAVTLEAKLLNTNEVDSNLKN